MAGLRRLKQADAGGMRAGTASLFEGHPPCACRKWQAGTRRVRQQAGRVLLAPPSLAATLT